MKIDANLIRSGNILRHKSKLLQVLNTSIIKPGKGGAFIQVEMKDIRDGTKYNERWRTVDSVEKASVNEVEATFLFMLLLIVSSCEKSISLQLPIVLCDNC